MTAPMMIRSFVYTGSTLPPGKGYLIHHDILYRSKLEGGLSFIDARNFFKSMKRYAKDRLDDPLADVIDIKLKLKRSTRAQILTWVPEALTCMISKSASKSSLKRG